MSGVGLTRARAKMEFTFGAGPSNVTRDARSDEGINGTEGKPLDGMMISAKAL